MLKVGIVSFFELCIFYIGFSSIFYKRVNNSFYRYAAGVFFIILSILNSFWCLSIAKVTFAIVIYFILSDIFFEGRYIYKFGLTAWFYGISFILDFTFYMVLSLDKAVYNVVSNDYDSIFVIRIISKFILLTLIIIITKKRSKNMKLSYTYWLRFVSVSIISTLGLVIIVIPEEKTLFSSRFILPVFVIILNLLGYFNINDMYKLSEKLKVKAINEERIENELRFLKKIEEKDDLQRKVLHDYSNTMLCLGGLLQENKIKEAKEFINNMAIDIKTQGSFISTGNSLIDVLINAKYTQAKECGIVMLFRLDNLSKVAIKNKDLVIIIGNLLDNAIEHCQKLQNKEKVINAVIKCGDSIKILVRNPIEQEIHVENSIVKSTKKGDNHGIGLSNVKDVVDEYGGSVFVDVKNGFFEYMIIIPV